MEGLQQRSAPSSASFGSVIVSTTAIAKAGAEGDPYALEQPFETYGRSLEVTDVRQHRHVRTRSTGSGS